MKLGVFWKFIVMKKEMSESTGKNISFLCAALFLLFLGLVSGCGNKFFDPSQVGRFRPVPAVNVILDSLGVAEEAPVAWEGAEEPLPIDSVATETDYVFRSGDVVSVAVFELLQEGVQYVNNYVVTETGKISLPEVGVILAAGLSETQLEDRIRKILTPNILKEPLVTVTLVRSQQRAFSILGDGVSLPGRYFIPRYNFRLTDALATAGGSRQFNVSYIYVSRYAGDEQQTPDSVNPGFGELELKVVEPETTIPVPQRRNNVTPRAQYQWPKSNVVISSSEMATDR
jgi:protein involved in polysaccharide export with SLBB domain